MAKYAIDHEPVAPEAVARLIAAGKVIGWFEGGSEFGPRALGHRSILADPRDPAMKDTLNKQVKFREPYRPYAPSILAEHAAEWLHLDCPSPFMLMVVEVREDKRALVPAVTHIDDTTRPQTVTESANPNYYRLLKEFHRLTDVPMVLNTSLNINREPIVETPLDALICAFGTAIDYVYVEGLLIECGRYASPELVKRLMAERAATLEEQWQSVKARYLSGYDEGERDAYLAEENRIAEWRRDYKAKYEIENIVSAWTANRASVVIVGTRAHTRCLYEHIDGFPGLDVRGFVPLDGRPAERGEFNVYSEVVQADIDWRGIDAVLVSTHEYQDFVADEVRAWAPHGTNVVTIYDSAGDSLQHVLPGKWPVLNPIAGAQSSVAVRAVTSVVDDESRPAPVNIADRYAVIVRYEHCGTGTRGKAIAPADLDRQLKALTQNFVCTTIGELTNPHARLPETVAVVTFDHGFKDVLEHALPVLQRWEVPATMYCASAPLLNRTLLNVHRVELLLATLGTARLQEQLEIAIGGGAGAVDAEGFGSGADARVDGVLRKLFEQFIGREEDIASSLYLSADEIRSCRDAGVEIGVQGHEYRVHSRLNDEEQRCELETAVQYFRQEFGLTDLHWSHPYGTTGNWNAATNRLIAQLGFSSGVTRVRMIVKPSDLRGRWELPRFDAQDVFDSSNHLLADKLHALFVSD